MFALPLAKMKHFITILFLFIGIAAFSQSKKSEKVAIKTSAKCDDCKERIEKALAFEKGVKDVTVNLETAVVTVTYIPKKTNPASLKIAISSIGYDADEVKAEEKAYHALPLCCQKGH
jgi:cation transport ATPase